MGNAREMGSRVGGFLPEDRIIGFYALSPALTRATDCISMHDEPWKVA